MSNKTLYYFGGFLTVLSTLVLSEVLHTSEILSEDVGIKQVETLILEKHQYNKELVPSTLVYEHKTNN